MTTTAVRTPRTVPYRDGDVMGLTFAVAPRRGDAPPRAADACRVGNMRRIAAARLRYCGLEAMTDDVMLIVSELLTNAILHSRTTEISLSMTIRDGFLRITIVDGMPGGATPKHANANAESGRGLALVEAVVKENGGNWGTCNAGAGTWCMLAVPAEERS
ncbi:ATP-binding protein [Streptomyces sp. NPDC048479]|uniref:ATP-binding protein n=1 Tax=Streptomyces sp. NPDC048479 TaxID=3154725 RepID=UPI00341464DF